jgi:hypothetical protein
MTHSLQLPRLQSALLARIKVLLPAKHDRAEIEKRLDAVRHQTIELRAQWLEHRDISEALEPSLIGTALGSE